MRSGDTGSEPTRLRLGPRARARCGITFESDEDYSSFDEWGGVTGNDMVIETANGVVPRDHVVQFYEHDDTLVASVASFLVDGLNADEALIVVATPVHMAAFEAALTSAGIDVGLARAQGTLITADAQSALSRCVVDGWPDTDAFAAVVGDLIGQAAASGRRVRIYGEMVALLWDAGQIAEAIELEALWNVLGRRLPFSLYCAYRSQSVVDDEHATSFRRVCHLHSAVVGEPAMSSNGSGAASVARAEDARSFPCELRSSSLARHFVADRLTAWGRESFVDDASLVVAELVTNSLIHARSEFVVAVSFQADTVRVSVRDASMTLPAMQEPTPCSTSGRGLILVAAVAQEWGTELLPDGKVVWAELRGN